MYCWTGFPKVADVEAKVRKAVENGRDRITDLHIWQVGPGSLLCHRVDCV